ncbi:hypothetical protein Agabi119p4_4333 [Agaricus bisporus var. burnettii]|uniref:Uncharacterized protein n=1 Tax=Agaricus bisporus var. burnettii TaxID=192524 RepID=A0A8H7F2Y4_AGABI|nr:hypothetical protein Agabi119p4_4333 [Agaricus bisporus var. burnettii]
MKIEWASNFAPDGSRRQPPPSTIHGWLAKWRGTFTGNEHVRSKGMAEMRKASAYRKARRRYERKKAEKQGGVGILSLFRGRKPRQPTRHSARTRALSRKTRPSHSHSKKSPNAGRRLTTSRQPNPNLKPRANTPKRGTNTHPPLTRREPTTRRPTGRR